MDFSLSEDQQSIREAVERICASFDDDYWAECDRVGRFPEAFRSALSEGGWLGIAMPEAYGGSGLGITGGPEGDGNQLRIRGVDLLPAAYPPSTRDWEVRMHVNRVRLGALLALALFPALAKPAAAQVDVTGFGF